MVLGIAALWSGDRLRPIVPLPLEERNRYFRLLQLSHTMQLILVKAKDDKASHREVSGSGIILGIFMELAIDKGQQELAGLYHEYLTSLVSFENFSKSATAQRFFLAMCKAQQEIAKSPDAVVDFISATTAKHKAEWDALIRRDTSSSPSEAGIWVRDCFRIRCAESYNAAFENRSAADTRSVSTGSAKRCAIWPAQ